MTPPKPRGKFKLPEGCSMPPPGRVTPVRGRVPGERELNRSVLIADARSRTELAEAIKVVGGNRLISLREAGHKYLDKITGPEVARLCDEYAIPYSSKHGKIDLIRVQQLIDAIVTEDARALGRRIVAQAASA